MKINSTYAISYLNRQFLDGEISREVMDELTEFVQTYSMYLAAVRRELAECIELGVSYDEFLVQVSHERILNRLIKDCSAKHGLVGKEKQVD